MQVDEVENPVEYQAVAPWKSSEKAGVFHVEHSCLDRSTSRSVYSLDSQTRLALLLFWAVRFITIKLYIHSSALLVPMVTLAQE